MVHTCTCVAPRSEQLTERIRNGEIIFRTAHSRKDVDRTNQISDKQPPPTHLAHSHDKRHRHGFTTIRVGLVSLHCNLQEVPGKFPVITRHSPAARHHQHTIPRVTRSQLPPLVVTIVHAIPSNSACAPTGRRGFCSLSRCSYFNPWVDSQQAHIIIRDHPS